MIWLAFLSHFIASFHQDIPTGVENFDLEDCEIAPDGEANLSRNNVRVVLNYSLQRFHNQDLHTSHVQDCERVAEDDANLNLKKV